MLDRDEMEIGGTKGKTHEDVLTQTLGREDGLRVATGVSQWKGPVVEGERGGGREREGGRGGEHEITEKKIERHGDIGGEA